MFDGTGLYLKNIGRVPILKAEEEIKLGRAIKTWQDTANPSPAISARGKRAKEKMISSNLRLVVHVAKKYQHRGLELDELIQEGSLGLNRAVEKFDFTKGYKFSTYAFWWIRQSISRAISEQSRTVRLPIHVWEKLNKVQKARRNFMEQHGHEPNIVELCETTGIPEEKLLALLESCHQTDCVSLDKTVGQEKNNELIELVASQHQGTFEAIAQQNVAAILSDVLDQLTENEAFVIRRRFGLDDGEKKTLGEIGEVLSITPERVRQIELKALRKLRCKQEVRTFRGVA